MPATEKRLDQGKSGVTGRPGRQGPVHTGSVAKVRHVGFCFCFISELNGVWGGLVLYGEGVFDSKGDGRRWRLLTVAGQGLT